MDELKPCPFCGGEARTNKIGLDYVVHCIKCFCGTDQENTPNEAIDTWNRRVDG